MWDNRKKVNKILNKQLSDESEIIYEGFNIINEMLHLFENYAKDETVLQIVGLIFLKGTKSGKIYLLRKPTLYKMVLMGVRTNFL